MASSSEQKGRRYGQVIKLKPLYADEYISLHKNAWPGILKRISNCNIQDYSIFYDPRTSLLFGTFTYTGKDFDTDMAAMAADEETQRWWAVTDSMQESLNAETGAKSSVDGGRDGWWREMDEVFHHP